MQNKDMYKIEEKKLMCDFNLKITYNPRVFIHSEAITYMYMHIFILYL